MRVLFRSRAPAAGWPSSSYASQISFVCYLHNTRRLRLSSASRHLVATFLGQRRASFRKETMSVAFRRESDDEHKEPAFELPIPVGPNLVTPRGLRLLGEAVARLEAAIAVETDEDTRKKLQPRLRYFHTRQATADRSKEHTSELQSLMHNSYAVSCLKTTIYIENTQ